MDPNVIHKIEETKNTKIQNIGYIAKVNKDKTEIINVYLDRKTAAKFNNYKSDSGLDYHVKYETITNEHYYILFDKCDEKLKNDFIKKNNGEPILYKDGIGQFDDTNKFPLNEQSDPTNNRWLKLASFMIITFPLKEESEPT